MSLVLGYSPAGSIHYIILPQERLEEVQKLLETDFYPYESICVASDVSKNPKAVEELNSLVAECIPEGVSVAAIETTSNKIVGCLVNKLQTKLADDEESFFEKFTREKCQQKQSISLMNVMVSCDSHINVFELLNINKILELMFLVVSAEHRKRGIGNDLIKYGLKLLEQLKLQEDGPQAATALFTSSYSQKIGEKLDFQVLSTINYSTFTYDGVKFSDKISKQHRTIKLVVKKGLNEEAENENL